MQELEMARELARRVSDRGGRVYFVGGLVRDRLLGIQGTDIDVEVHGITPRELEDILDSLGSRLEMGSSFGIYGLKGWDLDIAMPRQEQATGRGHRDFRVTVDPFIGPEKAAMRRDFTINAMMEDVLTGEVLDPFRGREDLEAGILRHVNDASFAEDALRVLRGAQFAARFDLRVAPQTLALCRTLDLGVLPRERVLEELRKALLKAENPSRFFAVLEQMGQLGCWFPELRALRGVPQSPRYHAEGDVWNHTMLVLDQAAARRQEAEQPFPFLLAALTHDFGKAVSTEFRKGDYHAYAHETLGLHLVEAFLNRLTGERALIRYVLNLTELHMKPNRLTEGSSLKSSNKLFDDAASARDLILLAVCDDLGRVLAEGVPGDKEPLLWDRLRQYREVMARPHVTGADLVSAGLAPGPRFREVLDYAHKLRLAGIPRDQALPQVLGHAKSLGLLPQKEKKSKK